MLIGDFDDIIRVAVIFLFVVVPIITQIVKSARKAENQQNPQPRPRPRPQPARPPRQPGQDLVQNEIDAFLRRAAQRRGGAQAQQVEVVPPQPVQARVQPAMEAEVVQAERVLGGVSAHVQQHLPKRQFEQRIESLGSSVGQADEKMEGHLQSVFDHGLGRLPAAGVPSAAASKISQGTDAAVWQTADDDQGLSQRRAEGRAADIARVLRDPSGLKTAVILAEILKRPEHRFSKD